MKVKAIFSVSSSIGKRPSMQDTHAYVEALGKHKYSFLGVYDGHGGTVFAELAAQKIHRSVETYLNSSTKPLEAVKKAFIDLDSEICRLGVKGGTTASVVLLRNCLLYTSSLIIIFSNLLIKGNSLIRILYNSGFLYCCFSMSKYKSSSNSF